MRAFSFETRNTFVIQSRAEFYLFKRVIVPKGKRVASLFSH